jgi:hypothetical protein
MEFTTDELIDDFDEIKDRRVPLRWTSQFFYPLHSCH